VRCADQRSQQKNKIRAMTVLRSRLLEAKVAEEMRSTRPSGRRRLGPANETSEFAPTTFRRIASPIIASN
jgi:peptide chain release factor 1